MRVVLDTNVVIAAFATRGLSSEIFEVCISEHTIIISEFILFEIKEKLSEKIHIPQHTAQNIITYIRDISEVVEPEELYEPICRDRDDDMIIATALAGKAQFIITGDKDLLVLKSYEDIRMLTPREFWVVLRQPPQ
jgi:putative PIN family toxin of toxin-antitoxin system